MKNNLIITGQIIVIIACLLFIQFKQDDLSYTFKNFGKGEIYLTNKHVIRDITIREIKSSWIIYEKQGNLHDLLIERISYVFFPKVSAKIVFENNTQIFKVYY